LKFLKLPCNPDKPANFAIDAARDYLDAGSLIITPTDTVYGLLAHPGHPEAIKRVYQVKYRDQNKPLPLLIDCLNTLEILDIELAPSQLEFLLSHWPGPTTAILSSAGGPTHALRIPHCKLVRSIAEACGGYLISTSANISGEQDTNNSSNLDETLLSHVGLLLDAEQYGSGEASAIIDLTQEPFKVIR
jgi:L-threonylcarbamoyladenylate synthase